MQLRTPWIALLAGFAVLALSSCGDKPKSAKKAEQNVIFIKGDPKVFFKNTANHPGGTIQEASLDFQAEWGLAISGFSNLGKKQKYSEIKNSEDPNGSSKAAAEDQSVAGDGYRFRREADGTIVVDASAGNALRFTFRVDAGILNLISLVHRGKTLNIGREFDVIHNSSSPQGDAHSILVYFGKEHKKQALGLILRKLEQPSVAAQIARGGFEYMFGTDVKVAWNSDRPLELQMCQPALPILNRMFDNALKEWRTALDGRLILQRGPLQRCPPFSDINTQTVHVIDEWIEVLGADTMKPGLALVQRRGDKPELVDADIFIFMAEWDEVVQHLRGGGKVDEDFIRYNYYGSYRVQQVLQRTFTHEVGHALGLHHKLKGPPSMMSYDDLTLTLYDYDRRAIQELYPVNPNLVQAGTYGGRPNSPLDSSVYPSLARNPHPARSKEWYDWEIQRILRSGR